MDSVRKLREEFAITIRRQKKEELFKSYRRKLRVEMIEQQQNKMIELLSAPEIRQEWICKKARDLSGIPDPTWRFILDELFSSLMCFKGKGAFKIWISTQIIKNICSLFQQDYIHLGLAPEAAKLLGNIIYLQQEQQQLKTSQIANEIFNQQILMNLILYSQDSSLSHEEISHLMTLIFNMALNDFTMVVKNGGFTTFVQWSMRILRQRKINRAYLDLIYNFFHVFASKLDKIPTNLNSSIKLLCLLNEFSQIDQSVYLLTKMLEIIQIVLVYTPKDSMYKNFFNLKQLTNRTFQLGIHQNQRIRQLSWKILGLASSGQFDMIEYFQQNNYIDRIMFAYQIEPKDNRNFDKITSNILSCVSNLICEGDVVRQTIINSPILNIAIDSTHPDRSINVRKDAYYCLCTAISTGNYNLLNQIIYSTPILEKLVFGMENMLDKDKNTIKDIVITLFKLIKDDQNVFKNQGNNVLEMLESKYCFSNILNAVLQKYHKDSQINHIINSIFDLYSC